jgi:tripartite-type tricarboxylate transporter receptor subunit TctC
MKKHIRTIALSACFATVATLAQAQQSVEEFYKAKPINFIIGTGEGGGYDFSSRFAAQYLGKFLPGNPTIIPRNMPGAGSIAAAEYMFSVAPHDGTYLAMFQPTFILEKLNDPRRKFVSQDFTYIGRMDSSTLVGLVSDKSPAQTIDEAKKVEVVLSANAAAGTSATIPWALNRMIGTKFKVILGYNSSAAMGLAIDRGEAFGNGSTSWDYLLTKQEWFDEKKIKILYVIALERFSKLPDVPTVLELVTDPRHKNALKLISSTSSVGRAIVAPPNNEPTRTAALRAAYEAMMKDPAFIADAEKRKLGVDFLDGKSLQALVADVATQPQDIVDLLKEMTLPPN